MNKRGFTLVELLIVIVVIAILAAITIVAYQGVQGRAYDAAVQSDLEQTGKKIIQFSVEQGRFPKGNTDLNTLGMKITKNAYGIGFDNTGSGDWYNLVYCWPNTATPNSFALVAQSKTGNVYQFSSAGGGITKASYAFINGSLNICNQAGITLDNGNARDWFYSDNVWQSYAG